MGNRPVLIRIVIADAQPTFRENLRRVLESKGGVQVVGEAADVHSAIELTGHLKPDVLLLEYDLSRKLELHGSDGRGNLHSAVRTVVMVTAPGKSQILESFRLGAQGVVLKESAPRVWWNSIKTVRAGRYWLGSESVAILVQALQEFLSLGTNTVAPADYGLTRREREIITKIANGLSNREVGREFSIRERTVKHHLTNIFNKVGVSSRLELALFARDHHLLQNLTTPAETLPVDRHERLNAKAAPESSGTAAQQVETSEHAV